MLDHVALHLIHRLRSSDFRVAVSLALRVGVVCQSGCRPEARLVSPSRVIRTGGVEARVFRPHRWKFRVLRPELDATALRLQGRASSAQAAAKPARRHMLQRKRVLRPLSACLPWTFNVWAMWLAVRLVLIATAAASISASASVQRSYARFAATRQGKGHAAIWMLALAICMWPHIFLSICEYNIIVNRYNVNKMSRQCKDARHNYDIYLLLIAGCFAQHRSAVVQTTIAIRSCLHNVFACGRFTQHSC